MKRGDIYIAHLDPRSGSEQNGIRPVLILSHDGFNQTQNWHSIIIVPLTTSAQKLERSPTVVKVHALENNLDKDSYILCHQITTLDKAKLHHYIGTLSPDLLLQVEQALQYAVGIFE